MLQLFKFALIGISIAGPTYALYSGVGDSLVRALTILFLACAILATLPGAVETTVSALSFIETIGTTLLGYHPALLIWLALICAISFLMVIIASSL